MRLPRWRGVLRASLWLLPAALSCTLTSGTAAEAAAVPAPEIRWPTPSQPPGSVTFQSRYPTESAWDPALAQFAPDRGAAFQEMADAAQRFAAAAGRAPRADLTAPRRWGVTPPTRARLLRLVDIVRLPVLPVAEMAPHLKRARSQLLSLRKRGLGRAVWEVRDLPDGDALADWSEACLDAFPQPPVLMLGWHLDGGRIAPAHDPMVRFLEAYAKRCHSVMLTGEELNTQFYASADGGRALPFLRYWAGVVRSCAPRTFVWCRIDEVLAGQRPNSRQETWVRSLLPLCDGLVYQVHHGEPDVREGRRVSEQFQAVEGVVGELRRGGDHPPRQEGDSPWPVLLGGFVAMRPALPGRPAFGAQRVATELEAYEAWLAAEGIPGYIRYVGMLPAEPVPELVADELPEVAVAPQAREGGPTGATPAEGQAKP